MRTTSLPARRLSLRLTSRSLEVIITLLSVVAAQAQTEATWTSGTEGNWSDLTKWSTNPVFPNNGNPSGATYNVTIPGPSGTTRVTQDVIGGVTIENLSLSGLLTLANALTVNGNFNLTAGGIAGSAPLTISGALNWQAGSLAGGGVITANGGVALSGSGFKQLGSTLVNNGTATWTGGSVTMLGGSVFQNSAGATFDAQSDSSFVYFSGAAPAFNNAGTFAKSSGAGTTSFSAGVDFNNSGSVAVQTGTLGLFGGGTSTGSFVVSSGAGLTFAGDHDLQAGSSITGAGVVSFTGSSALGSNVIGGTYNVADTQITGGRNDFNADVTTGTATLSGNTAVLQGSGQFTATGVFTWSGATMSGSGVTRAQGGLTINGDAVKTLGRTLENSGSATWTGTGNVEMLDGGVFVNATSGTFAAQNDAGFVLAAGATAAEFRNGGAFTKIGGLGTTSFGDGVAFTNSGTVTAVSGTLSFQGGYTQTAGSLVLNGGSVFASTPLDIDGGSVAGSGTMNAAILNGGNISPGLADSAGNLIVNGEVTFEAASRLTIEIGGRLPGLQYDRLTSSGATALAGFLDVSFIDGFEQGAGGVAALDSFTILDGTTLIGSFSNAPDGSRVATSDGLGSFVVSYSGNDVVLSQFQAVPEPSTIAMLVVGGMTGFILYCRRRQ